MQGVHGDAALKLRIAAPPADGRANAEVVRFLARTIGVSGSEVDVIQGASGRNKVVRVKATDAETVARSLSGSL